MKKGQEIELKIEGVDFPNKGYGFIEEERVVIKHTIPGQVVKGVINKKRKNKLEARHLGVIEKAPNEVEYKCKYFTMCGGCNYQNLEYKEQLELKMSQVKKLVDTAGINYGSFDQIESSPIENEYRNKMEFSFGDAFKDGPLELGMHKRGSFHDIVNIVGCNIVSNEFSIILDETLNYCKENELEYYKKRTHEGYLRHLVVRKSFRDNNYLVSIVTSSQTNHDFTKLANILKDKINVAGFIHIINDGLADVVKADEMNVIYGQDHIMERLFDLDFKISQFSFFQTNTKGAEKLYSVVREFAGEHADRTIFDLYCGTGTIAQVLSHNAKKVYGIELVAEAVEAAKENAKLNNINNCEFIAGDVYEKVHELSEEPDLIILDPPRDGIHPKAIGKIIDFNAKEMVYVSCKPSSLARDLKIFEEAGYTVEKIKCVDMFPQTVHVETVAKLIKK
ncbi:MAG: 23S rRNA (uracil(1939)-C(5))-methyltransferase RlmD [Clostridia bacterium]|jgi:23S rRNA (uracil-5-)-methyltransferase RumA|nr:23S rRNA (uracil(1939)-C(5))-methyltransferase RlmD [Clostridia bacterium]